MRTIIFSLLLIAAASTQAAAQPAKNDDVKRTPAPVKVESIAFAHGAAIPSEHTCDNGDLVPPLAWSAVPKDAKSIAILVEDPDAARLPLVHWMVTNVPPRTTKIFDGVLPHGATAAQNDKGVVGYSGPCPPSKKHRYYFHVYALDTTLATPANRSDFLMAIKGHVLAEGVLIGTYKRQSQK